MRRSTSGRILLYLGLSLATGLLQGCTRVPSGSASSGETASGTRPTWGATMGEVGRRFELVGRATTAGRTELARYHLGEIEEIFEDALAHAAPPHEGQTSGLQPMRTAFLQTNVPELRRALDARDRQGFAAAFAQTAVACNACHQASGHGFIEIPTAPGVTVPRLDPVP